MVLEDGTEVVTTDELRASPELQNKWRGIWDFWMNPTARTSQRERTSGSDIA